MADVIQRSDGTAAASPRLRRIVHRQFDPSAWAGKGLSPANRFLVAAIIAATILAILRTEPLLADGRDALLNGLDMLFGTIFVTEYALRLWAAGEAPRFAGLRGRLRYAFTPGALIDAAVVIATFAPMIASGLVSLRLLRVVAILRFARLGRFSTAVRHLTRAVSDRRDELLLTVLLGFALIIGGATAMWLAEGDAQPDKFGSIPRAMWWAAVTLTTIGYGDVFPVTILGKFIAVIVAIAGIGLIAMPAGILAAAFSDAIQRSRNAERPCDTASDPRDGSQPDA
ncbi:ion transporter [Sphingosinicella sp. BN140058]|uniref:ion transporter n=1 Tax=Sphingosinicella sp. BN140058 TaxID=1892855 RepID=UPI00101127CC|nr:ion transporter [Sphingosinicella sp. BN140058]QAY78574.1 ion transporter [Sphingosinicella sp. BN140058]